MTVLFCLLALGGCTPSGDSPDQVVRVGFFANVTHAPVLIGLADGSFQKALPRGWTIQSRVFPAGPELMVALASGALDIAYVGPVPYLTAKARGVPVAAQAGVCRGGVRLVAIPAVARQGFEGLGGRVVLVPQFGNTQDIQLRMLLERLGVATDGPNGVRLAQANPADADALLLSGQAGAALLPEPWGSALIHSGRAVEMDIPAGGEILRESPVTVLVSSEHFARRHSGVLGGWLEAHRQVVQRIRKDPGRAAMLTDEQIQKWTGKSLPRRVAQKAFRSCVFDETLDSSILAKMAQVSARNGYLPRRDGLVESLVGEMGGRQGG